MLSVNCRLISDAVRIAGRGRHGASSPRSRSTSFGLGRRELPSEQPSGKKLSNQFRGSTCCSTERLRRLGFRPYERKSASFFFRVYAPEKLPAKYVPPKLASCLIRKSNYSVSQCAKRTIRHSRRTKPPHPQIPLCKRRIFNTTRPS